MARVAKKAGVEDPVGAPATTRTRSVAKKSSASEFDDLLSLALETKALEDEQRALTGGSNTWVRIIQSGSDVTNKRSAAYIPGAEEGDYLVGEKNILLHEPEITVLAMFKVYSEKKPSGKESEMDHTVGFWLPDDAEQIPLLPGDNFRRILGNGNYLIPMHWMFIYIHDHPEIKDALVPFQSIGNSYFTEIAKIIKKNSSMSTELRLRLSAVGELNKSFNKTFMYPTVDIVGKNFEIDVENGKISAVKGGLGADEIREVLTRSNEAQKAYKELKLVTKRSEQQLLALLPAPSDAAPARRGLPGSRGKAAAYVDEEDGEVPNF